MSGKSSVPSILPLKIALFLVIVMLTPLVLGIHECTSTQNPYPIHKTLSVGGYSENVFDSEGKLISACCRQPTDCVPFSGSCLSEGWVVDVRSPPGTPDICKGSVWKNPDETRELCDQVEKKQPGRPRETDPLFEMVDGRSTFVGCCQDDTGEYSTKCQQPGASADVNCGPNGNTIRCCSPDLLEAGVEKKDPGERFCVIEDFGGFTCKVPKKVHQFGADGKFFFCSDGLWLDVDADKTGAQCKSVQGLKWAIGGEINDCCGDDVGQEFSRTCDIDSQNANADSQTTSNCAASAPAKIGACCDKASDCVDQAGACKTAGNCFPLGQSGKLSFCRETVSLTNTPVGVWEDPDKERSFCEAPGCNSGIPFKFGLTGSKGGGKCCGDDEGENIRECKDQSDNGDCSSTPTQQVFACCGPADCVDEKGQCRASGGLYLFGNQPDISSPQKKSFCDNGIWKDPDDIGAGCTPPFVYGIPQEAQPNLPASTGCCGDDANEFANSKLCQTGVCTANTNDRACCDAQKDCVSNGKCITDKDMFDIDNDGDKELCNLGKWEDADQNLQNCNKHDMNPSPVAFMAGAVCGRGDCNEITATGTAADSSFCCGDDEFELPFPGNNQVCFRSNTSRSPETLDCFKNSRYYKNGDFIGDEICENGNFTSRTKAIAAALLELANKTSPKNFTLFCDSYENALNYLNYPARGTDIALRFFDGKTGAGANSCKFAEIIGNQQVVTELPCVNNVCVLQYQGDADVELETAFGASLNAPINSGAFPFVNVLEGIGDCNDAISVGEDREPAFRRCQSSSAKAWYNEKLKAVIYSKDGILTAPDTFSIDFADKFLTFIRNPIRSIINYAQFHLFTNDTVGSPSDYRFVQSTKQFSRLYLQRKGFKSVRGVVEKTDNKKNEYLGISYTGFNQDICQTIAARDVLIRDREGFFSRFLCGYEPRNDTYYLSTASSTGLQSWLGLTAQLRVNDLGCKKDSKPFIQQFIVPDIGVVGQPVQFSAEVEVCQTPYSFSWDVVGDSIAGDNEKKSVLDFKTTFSKSGPKHVAFTLTDAGGNSITETRDLFIASSANCEVKDGCAAGESTILELSSEEDAHASLVSSVPGSPHFPKKLCCPNLYQADDACAGFKLLRLSGSRDAHATLSAQTGGFSDGSQLCLKSAFAKPSCTFKPSDCGSGETCIAKLSSQSDAHISSCVGQATNFPIRVCCSLEGDIAVGSICNEGETKPCGLTEEGECSYGVQTCTNGRFGGCAGIVAPVSEVCGDGKDNDCNGQVDNGCSVCTDADNDGVCAESGDCQDNDAAVNSRKPEVCGDGKDNNCNAQIDENCVICTDADNDGVCKETGDCVDTDPAVNPNKLEVCGDSKDNDCDAAIDEGCTVCTDSDKDLICREEGDCNDQDSTIGAGNPELCHDAKDNDCDTKIDENCPPTVAFDFDNNGVFELRDVFVIILTFEDSQQGTGLGVSSPLTFDANNDGAFSNLDVVATVNAFLQKT